MVIDTLLFDMDGTLTDIHQRWILPVHRGLQEFKPDYDQSALEQNVPKLIELSGETSPFFLVKILWSVARIAGLSRVQSVRYINLMRSRKSEFKKIVMVDGAKETLDEIAKTYKLALVTSASRSTVDVALKETIIGDYFKHVVTRNDVEMMKPDPEPITKALELIQSSPEKSAMIGDFPLDVRAGKAAGVKTFAILGPMGKYTKELILTEKPDFILNQISELPVTLKSIPSGELGIN